MDVQPDDHPGEGGGAEGRRLPSEAFFTRKSLLEGVWKHCPICRKVMPHPFWDGERPLAQYRIGEGSRNCSGMFGGLGACHQEDAEGVDRCVYPALLREVTKGSGICGRKGIKALKKAIKRFWNHRRSGHGAW